MDHHQIDQRNSGETEDNRSSFGLLPAETLANISDMSCGNSLFEVSQDDPLFKNPLTIEQSLEYEPTPIASRRDSPASSSLPPKLLAASSSSSSSTATYSDTQLSAVANPEQLDILIKSLLAVKAAATASKMENEQQRQQPEEICDQSSFSWDEVLKQQDMEKDDDVDDNLPSFCSGKITARSTSYGGSGSSSNNNTNRIEEDSSDNCYNPFDGSQQQNQNHELDDLNEEVFQEMNSQEKLELLNQAEKENSEKYKFIQEQAMITSGFSTIGGASSLAFESTSSSSNVLSRSDYFLTNTSCLGNSISTKDENSRPKLGLGTIMSPKIKPQPLLDHSSSNSSSSDSTFTITRDSSSQRDSVPKNLEFSGNESGDTDSGNGSSVSLEEILVKTFKASGQLDLSLISNLASSQKISTEQLISILCKSLDSGSSPNSTLQNDEIQSNISTNSKKSKKKSSLRRHSSPLKETPGKNLLRVQQKNQVIKSASLSKIDPNVSIVILDDDETSSTPKVQEEEVQMHHCSSKPELKILTKDGDTLDFGTLPEDCKSTEELILVHGGDRQRDITLKIQHHNILSFSFPREPQSSLIKYLSSESLICRLPKNNETIACSIKVNIHTPANMEQAQVSPLDLKTHISVLCGDQLLALVPVIVTVGHAKLRTLKADKLPVVKANPDGKWAEEMIPMMNSGNIPLRLLASFSSCTLGALETQSEAFEIFPQCEYKLRVKFSSKATGNGSCTLNLRVQPNGLTYEVPLKLLCTEGAVENETTKDKEEFQFPIQADRAVMSWLSVGVGCSEEQILVLRNVLDRSLKVTISVRDSKLFKLKMADGLVETTQITMSPLSTQNIKVMFTPSSLINCLSLGKLVLKPHDLGHGSKAYKALILLQGDVGSPDLSFNGFGDDVNGKQTMFIGNLSQKENILKEMSVTNNGDGVAFVKLLSFIDGDFRLPSSKRITINPNKLIIPPGETKLIQLEIDPGEIPMEGKNHIFVGAILVFHGSELTRNIMRKAKQFPGVQQTMNNQQGFIGIEFDETFPDEDVIGDYKGTISILDIKHFYKKTKKMVVELTGINEEKHSSNNHVKFNPLPIEETLNESRMYTTMNIQHSPPTRCLPGLEDVKEESFPFKIDPDSITVKSGKSVEISLMNLTESPEQYDLTWPGHVLDIKPTSGILEPGEPTVVTVAATISESRGWKGSISVFSANESVQIPVTVEATEDEDCNKQQQQQVLQVTPSKIKFNNVGDQTMITLKNLSNQSIQWHIQDPEPEKIMMNCFALSSMNGILSPTQSVQLKATFLQQDDVESVEKSFVIISVPLNENIVLPSVILELQGPSSKPSTLKKSLYLDRETMTFPTTRLGQYSVVHVTLKNRSNMTQLVKVNEVTPPFSTKYTEVLVKPQSYVKFPVVFTPMATGVYKQEIVMIGIANKTLVGTLVGHCLPKL